MQEVLDDSLFLDILRLRELQVFLEQKEASDEIDMRCRSWLPSYSTVARNTKARSMRVLVEMVVGMRMRWVFGPETKVRLIRTHSEEGSMMCQPLLRYK